MCSAVQYCTVLYCTVLYSTEQYCTILYSTAQSCTVLYSVARYCTVLYSTAQHCTVLYNTVQYCAILWVIVKLRYSFHENIKCSRATPSCRPLSKHEFNMKSTPIIKVHFFNEIVRFSAMIDQHIENSGSSLSKHGFT